MMKKHSPLVSRRSLLTIHKLFVRLILDYADIIYDKPRKGSFIEKIERVLFNACLVITGAFKGTSRELLYQELGLDSLKDRRWHRKLCLDSRLNTEHCIFSSTTIQYTKPNPQQRTL